MMLFSGGDRRRHNGRSKRVKINGIHRAMTPREKRAALTAVRKLERQMGAEQFGWAVRKHFAIEGLKRTAKREIREMHRKIAQLEKRIA